MQHIPDQLDLFQIERSVWIAEAKIRSPNYDFAFEQLMACTRSRFGVDEIMAVGRFGAVEDYDRLYDGLLELGVRLVHSPEQHALCSELPRWYPLLEGLTPESWWFDVAPDADTAGDLAGWPLFLKGSRQTSRHQAKLSIIKGPEEYREAVAAFAQDRILHWQQVVIRRFERLQPIQADMGQHIPASFEFRSFWWKGQLVGAGPYFAAFAKYQWSDSERDAAMELAADAARRANLPFVVVDMAQRADGRWIVIEINDAQESGYAGVPRLAMWQSIVEMEGGQVEVMPNSRGRRDGYPLHLSQPGMAVDLRVWVFEAGIQIFAVG